NNDGDNIGVLLGNGLVRLDPDFPSIPEVTDILFPELTATFGRASSPRSGRLITCDVKPTNFVLPRAMKDHPGLPTHDGKPGLMVFQVMGKGQQAMVPPSIHPDGEEVIWMCEAKPVALDAAEVMRRAGLEAFLMVV